MNTKELQEQIQEDIITYLESLRPATSRYYLSNNQRESTKDALCQIVVDNFKKLDDAPKELITEGDKKLKDYLANQQFFNDTYDMEGY